jgi:hypothetical protein
MWEPRRLTTLWAFTACYRDSFTLPYQLYRPTFEPGLPHAARYCYCLPPAGCSLGLLFEPKDGRKISFRNTRKLLRQIPEVSTVHSDRCENIESNPSKNVLYYILPIFYDLEATKEKYKLRISANRYSSYSGVNGCWFYRSQRYFTTGCLPPISSYWRQTP